MNSLYKLYIKRTLTIFFIGILFTLLFLYFNYSSYIEVTQEITQNTNYTPDIYEINRLFSKFTSNCFILNTALSIILVYNFYMYRNKKTGVFIRQLPIKVGKDFIIKLILSLALIAFLIVFQLILFNLLSGGIINNLYEKVLTTRTIDNIYTESLSSLYNDFYSDFAMITMLTILITSSLTLFSSTLGIIGIAIAMPVVLYYSCIGFVIGASYFLNDINLNIGIYNYIDRLRNIDFDSIFNTLYYTILSIISVIMYVLAYFCNKHINYSKIGELFLFKWVKVLAYIVGTILGGFSFYFIGSSILQPDNYFFIFIILLICFLISYTIIKKIENIFI